MIVSINQPCYLPWLGYFDRIAASDIHITLDTVQFEKNSFVNRNKIRTPSGWCWLTLPVETSGHFQELAIRDLRVSGGHWRRKHWASIEQNYSRATHFGEHRAFFADVYRREWVLADELMEEINRYLLAAFDIHTRVVRASEMPTEARKSDLVLELCKRTSASTYLSGPLGRNYLDVAAFQQAGIRVIYHDYRHPTYPQVYPGFEPYMSAIDLLFACGRSSSSILRSESTAMQDWN